jgi:hypothetical protein
VDIELIVGNEMHPQQVTEFAVEAEFGSGRSH